MWPFNMADIGVGSSRKRRLNWREVMIDDNDEDDGDVNEKNNGEIINSL